MSVDSARLEVRKTAFFSIAEEMGAVLIRAAYSTNIKDRRDCSCWMARRPVRILLMTYDRRCLSRCSNCKTRW